MEHLQDWLKRNNDNLPQNSNSFNLARPFTVHSYFIKPTAEDKNNYNNNNTVNVQQSQIYCIEPAPTFFERVNNNLNNSWIKTKNCIDVNSKWFLAIIFSLILVVIIVLIIMVASKGQNIDACLTSTCIQTASRSLKYLDNNVDPCDNFYLFACGRFIKEEAMLDDDIHKNSFTQMTKVLLQQLQQIIKETLPTNTSKIRLALKEIFSKCMRYDRTTSNQELNNVRSILDSLGSWPMIAGNKWNESSFDFKELTVRLKKMGIPYSYFFAFEVSVNLLKTSTYQLKVFPKMPDILNNITRYKIVSNVTLQLGGNQSVINADIRENLDFLKILYKMYASKQPKGSYETIKSLSNKTGTDWLSYIKRLIDLPYINITEDEVIVMNYKNVLPNIMRIIFQIQKRTLANILFSEIIYWMYEYLPGVRQMIENKVPTSAECTDVVTKSLTLMINSLYVKNYFDKESKTQVENLVYGIRDEFMKILKTVDWLDEYTRKNAIEKLNSMKICVGYPEELLEDSSLENYYKNLKINVTTYLNAILSIQAFEFDRRFKLLKQPVKNCYWVDDSERVSIINAEYFCLTNGIRLPAAFLQTPVFEKNRPNYINYAVVGVIIGHEMTHGFDHDGKRFDKDGNYFQWWSNQTLSTFNEKTKCIINQYKKYLVPKLNLTINGDLTLGENIADNGGLKQSFLAYTNWVKQNGPEKMLPGLNYTTNQMFWIAFAQFMCSHDRLEYLQRIIQDVHAPAMFRVIGTVSNIESFSTDFNCPVDSPMNPKIKCKIW